jgi:hypothetical protein
MNANMSQGSMTGMLNGLQPNYDFINQYGTNPVMIGILLFVILLYYVVFHYGAKTDAATAAASAAATIGPSSSLSTLELFLWVMFIVILVLNGVRYFYDLDITTSIQGIFSSEPEVDINVTSVSGKPIKKDPVPEIKYEKQVFHVPGNKYNFSDARAICKAYGGKLANYDQIENAYKDGGEWCGYGWSGDQMALYPTQKKTYDKLQTIKGHEHDCGRTGINGGYIANPNVKFGVNCYGYKPKITPTERKLMAIDQIYPKTKDELSIEKKIYEWRRKLGEILVAPFNKTTWSKV